MKSPYISELLPNQVITATFLVQIKDIRQKKTGEPYLSLTLVDRTGEVDAKMWDNVGEVMDTFERDDFIKVKGLLQIYQNRPQFTVHKMVKIDDREVDFADYFPASEREPMEMFAELRQIISSVQNPHLRGLLNAFMDDEPLARLYRIAPAAKSVHHAYLGGLIEHVLSLCHLSQDMAQRYPFVDLDLLLTAAVLHDVGKTQELIYDRSFGYSTEGQLLGHIIIGLRMIQEKIAAQPDFPPKLRTLVEHLVISHHGTLEFGSPKVPLFPEAMLFHLLDNLDSKMECMRALIAKDRHIDGCWTGWCSPLERTVLKKSKFLAEEAPPATAEPEPEPEAEAKVPVSLFAEKLQQVWKSGE
jgi:3'-5' exoribonuclease